MKEGCCHTTNIGLAQWRGQTIYRDALRTLELTLATQTTFALQA
jgi:hypothetical protein